VDKLLSALLRILASFANHKGLHSQKWCDKVMTKNVNNGGHMRRHPNVANFDELGDWAPPGKGPEGFGGKAKRLTQATGGQKLGGSYFIVPAGHSAVPKHAHYNNEEAIFILQGSGTIEIGNEKIAVRPGDWISLPAGEAHAHQLFADQNEELRYLAMSTMNDVDVVTYQNSQKLMAACGAPPTGFKKVFHLADGNVPYWDGEGPKK
jgi:uncharacterized cupin superfamily protein